MTNGTIMRLAALAGAMLLAGCLHGGGGGGTLSPEDIDEVRSDPRIVRAKGIFERADTLLIPSLYLEATSSIRGRSRSEEWALRGQCSGTNCDLRDDNARFTFTFDDLMIKELITPTDVDLDKAEIGKRDGFDTLVLEGRSQVAEEISDNEIATAAGSATSWGLWGQHGYAAVELVTGSVQEALISGRISGALGYAFGQRNPTNPGGTGSATWEGPAEVISTRTFTRSQGKAILTIPDLARSRIGAEIEVAGNDISKPSWKDMALSQGRFTGGRWRGKTTWRATSTARNTRRPTASSIPGPTSAPSGRCKSSGSSSSARCPRGHDAAGGADGARFARRGGRGACRPSVRRRLPAQGVERPLAGFRDVNDLVEAADGEHLVQGRGQAAHQPPPALRLEPFRHRQDHPEAGAVHVGDPGEVDDEIAVRFPDRFPEVGVEPGRRLSVEPARDGCAQDVLPAVESHLHLEFPLRRGARRPFRHAALILHRRLRGREGEAALTTP